MATKQRIVMHLHWTKTLNTTISQKIYLTNSNVFLVFKSNIHTKKRGFISFNITLK